MGVSKAKVDEVEFALKAYNAKLYLYILTS